MLSLKARMLMAGFSLLATVLRLDTRARATKYYTGRISAVVPHRDGTFTFNMDV